MNDYAFDPEATKNPEYWRLRKPLERLIRQDFDSHEWEEYMAELVREAYHAMRCCSSRSPNKRHLCMRKNGHAGEHEAYYGPRTPREVWPADPQGSIGILQS